MFQMFSNFSYSSTNLDFVYLCLPLFTFDKLTHLCTNFVLVMNTDMNVNIITVSLMRAKAWSSK